MPAVITGHSFQTATNASHCREVKKFQGKLQFTHELVAPRAGGAGGDGDDASARLAQLKAENATLTKELSDLRGVESALQSPAPAPAMHSPPPTQQHQSPSRSRSPPQHQLHHQRRGPGVIGGAARGAAGGAVKGAIAGAILPGVSARDGAAAGAAVGATTGGVRGLRRRLG
jgi:hypothetical protein